MTPSNFCYFNGDLLRYDEVNLHISDLLFQRGYGVFDFFRSRGGGIPWLKDYRERLFSSIEKSGIETDLDREQFESIIYDFAAKEPSGQRCLQGHRYRRVFR